MQEVKCKYCGEECFSATEIRTRRCDPCDEARRPDPDEQPEENWTDEDEDKLEEFEERRRQRIADDNEY